MNWLLLGVSFGLAFLCFRQALRIQQKRAINGEVRDPVQYHLIRIFVMAGAALVIVPLFYVYVMLEPTFDMIGRSNPNMRSDQ